MKMKELGLKIGRICLVVVLSGPYLPLMLLLFDEKLLGYFIMAVVLLSIVIKYLPKKFAFENSMLIQSVSYAVSCFLCYILDRNIVLSCIFSFFVHFCHYILTEFAISLITNVIKTVQLWINLRCDILHSHTLLKKCLYYAIWSLHKLLKASIVILVLYEMLYAVEYFYEDHGLEELKAADIETNDCIPYTSFPDQIWFRSSDLEESVNVYYANKSLSYLGDHLIISEELTMSMKENSKLCKSFIGEDFFVTFNVTQDQYSANQNVEYYWSFNGTRIRESSSIKHGYWHGTSGSAYIFNFLLKSVKDKDSGIYVLHRKTTEMHSLENRKIKSQILQKDYKQFCQNERSEIVVDRKILKFYLIIYQRDISSHREVGTLVQINNFFKISTFRFLNSEMKLIHLINGRNIMNVCPFNTSCNPTVSLYHAKKQFYIQTSELMRPVSVRRVNVSFCVCPQAYGIHEFYLLFDDYFSIRFPLRLTLKPPGEVLDSATFRAMLECCRSRNNYKDRFDIIMESYIKKPLFYSIMEERFKKQQDKEWVYIFKFIGILFFVVLLLDKVQRILIYYFFIHKNNQYAGRDIYESKFDIFISYCSEDRVFAEDSLLPFIRDEFAYTVRTQNDILGNMNTWQTLKEYIRTCKVFLLIISKDYLNDELCFKLEYEMTLLTSIAESRIERDNVLVIKIDDCPNESDPLTMFEYIDWTNTLLRARAEEEKKEELRIWLRAKLSPNIIVHFLSIWIIEPVLREIR